MSYKVLLIDRTIKSIFHDKFYYKNAGFEILTGSHENGIERLLEKIDPDIVMIDLEMGGDDDIDICRKIRSAFEGPIMVIPRDYSAEYEMTILESGADDILAGILTNDVIIAHLKMLARRYNFESGSVSRKNEEITRIAVGEIEINRAARNVCIGEDKIALTTAEFDLLWLLARGSNRIVTRDELYRELLKVEYNGLDRSIDLRVSRLRKKLGDSAKNPRLIKSIRSEGYIFTAG